MEFKVRDLGAMDEKSTQEIEQELVDKHEQEISGQQEAPAEEAPAEDAPAEEAPAEQAPVEETQVVAEPPAVDDSTVLSYLKERYGKSVDSVDQLFEEREAMPEDVAAYLKFKKETGRGLSDFMKAQRDYSEVDADSLLVEYYMATEEGLDSDDVKLLIEDQFEVDEDIDSERDIKKKRLAKKKEVAKARKYFGELQDQYKVPLESSTGSGSYKDSEEFQTYQQYVKDAESIQQANAERAKFFEKKTSEFFENFEGFDFDIEGKKLKYKPGDAAEVRNAHSTPMNFINKFLDENGFIKDAAGYHTALAAAMNPTRYAKFFYEQGKADAVEDLTRKSKNVTMDVRRSPEVTSKGGMKVASLSSSSSRGLKIKSNKQSQ